MSTSQAKWTRFRIFFVFTLFLLIWGGVIARAFYLQVLHNDRLAQIAEREGCKIIKLDPVRGDILDRNGEKLAVSLEANSVFVEPTQIEDKTACAAKLAKVLNLNQQQLLERLKNNVSFTWVKRQVSPDEVARIQALELKGVNFLKENKRFYPNNLLAAHILGFVGVDSRGLEGLEMGYDKLLRGGASECRVKRDALGRTFLDIDTGTPIKNRGGSLTLTLDRRVQYVAETALVRAVEQYKAKGGLALVVRPKTGEILASALVPGFNPNVFRKYGPAQRRNRMVTDTFDPGSTFKVFVVAAALEEGLVKPEDRIFCENGTYKIGRNEVHDHHNYGWLTVNTVIKKSSNIGSVKIGEKVGPEKLYDYLTRFSFGQKTGIDFPGESGGLLRPANKWRKLDAANVAFGQGVSVTALQMTMAMSALANDGTMMKPYIVAEIRDSQGRLIKKNKPEIVRRAVSIRTARQIKAMLREVVTTGGTGVRADSQGYPSAGKTGTAQKIDRKTGSYSDEKYFSSFLGFVPYNDPELTIMVGLDEPETQTYGGTVAAPVFREIAEQVLPLLNVRPADTTGESGAINASLGQEEVSPEIPEKTVSNSVTVNLDPEAIASITSDKKEQELAVAAREGRLRVETAESRFMPGVMPDLSGLSMRRVLEMMAGYNVDCNFIGSGLAVWQKPPAGQTLQAGQVCLVKFEQW